jgi:Tfp pilus assembly protein PilF
MPRAVPFAIFAALLVAMPLRPPSLLAQDFSHPAEQTTTPAPQTALVQQANDALSSGDYAGAVKILSSLKAQLPNNPQVLYNLGVALDALSDTAPSRSLPASASSTAPEAATSSSNPSAPATAEAAYRAAIAADANFAPPHIALGLLLARDGRPTDARAQFNAALALPDLAPALKARALRALARLELSGDPEHSLPPNPSAASSNLLAALQLTPEQPDDVLLSAQIAEATPDLPSAESAYRRYLALPGNANDPTATAALAHILLAQHKPADAEALLAPAHAAQPANPAFTAQLAQAWLDSGDSAKIARAIPLVESLHTANPANPAITRLLARVYVTTGHPDQANPLYASLVDGQLNPDPILVTDYADLLIRQHRPAEAEKLLKQALAKPHSYPTPADLADAALHLAFAAQDIDDPKTTLQALALSATVQPPSPPALFLEATADEAMHQSRQAAEAYKKFLAASGGRNPEQESQARQRLAVLQHAK